MNDSFNILIPNVAFAWGTKYHLKDNEFMLYSHLQFMRQGSQWNQTYTSVEMIIKYLGLKTKNKQRDKENVIKILNNLVGKGYITISFDDDVKEGDIKKDFFTVKQVQGIFSENNVVEFEDNGKNRIFKGYTKVSGEHYNLAENEGRALMTIVYINWRRKIKYDVPKSEWVKVLSISKSTLEDSMNNYKDRFLKVIPGEYFNDVNGEVRQKTNKHLILYTKNRQTDSNDLTKDKNKIYLEKMWSKVTDTKVKSNQGVFLQIFDKNTYMRIDGFKVWKETTCNFVKINGQKKIDAIKQSDKKFSDKVISNLEKRYKEIIENEKKITKILINNLSNEEEEYENYEEYSSNYVKKDRTVENEILKYLEPVPSNSLSRNKLKPVRKS